MRKNIHNFTITGVIKDDSLLIKARENYERLLVQQMRDGGYVPILDMSSQWSTNYFPKTNHYGFYLTMFGVFVGKKKAKTIQGFSGQEFLSR